MNKVIFYILAMFLSGSVAYSQQNPTVYHFETQAIGTTNGAVPFWMRSNQFGSVPSEDLSVSFIGGVHKEYDTTYTGIFNWAAGFEGRVNQGNHTKLLLIEAYAKLRAGIFQLQAGRSRDIMGLNGDTTLSSGNFAISGNALGIPKIEISIPNYYTLPFFNDLIAIKGNFSHGWVGRQRILDTIRALPPNPFKFPTGDNNPITYFHQKSLYGRIGRPNWRLKLYGGLNHQVYWGNERKSFGNEYKLSNFDSFLHVISGKAYGSGRLPRSKVGNQLGSIDIGLEYNFNNTVLMLYRQNFYDVGALSKLANIRDGLNGISLRNKLFSLGQTRFQWKTILFEFLYTKNQAGESWSKPTKSGDEDYYNNYYYTKGWSYLGSGLGTPFITPSHLARDGQASLIGDYFINNRVVALHGGIESSFSGIDITTKISFSNNYGTFGTSPEGKTTGSYNQPSNKELFRKVSQFSFYLEGRKTIKNNFGVAIATALDRGRLLDNSMGISFKIFKQIN